MKRPTVTKMFSRRTCFTRLAAPVVAVAPAWSEPAKPNRCGIPIRPDLYEKIKAHAAQNGMTVKAVMEDAISEWLASSRQALAIEKGGGTS